MEQHKYKTLRSDDEQQEKVTTSGDGCLRGFIKLTVDGDGWLLEEEGREQAGWRGGKREKVIPVITWLCCVE